MSKDSIISREIVSHVVGSFASHVEREVMTRIAMEDCIRDVIAMLSPHVFHSGDVVEAAYTRGLMERIAAGGYDQSTATMVGDLLNRAFPTKGDEPSITELMSGDEGVIGSMYDAHTKLVNLLSKEIGRKFSDAVNKENGFYVYELSVSRPGGRGFDKVGTISDSTRMSSTAAFSRLLEQYGEDLGSGEDEGSTGAPVEDPKKLSKLNPVRERKNPQQGTVTREYTSPRGMRLRVVEQYRPILEAGELTVDKDISEDAIQDTIHDMFVYYAQDMDQFKKVLGKALTKSPPKPLRERMGRVFDDLPYGSTWLMPRLPPEHEAQTGMGRTDTDTKKKIYKNVDTDVLNKLKDLEGEKIAWIYKGKSIKRGDQLFLEVELPQVAPGRSFVVGVPESMAHDIKDRGPDAPYHFSVDQVTDNGVQLSFDEQIAATRTLAQDTVRDMGLDADQVTQLVRDMATDYASRTMQKNPIEMLKKYGRGFMVGGSELGPTPESLDALIQSRTEAQGRIVQRSTVLPDVEEAERAREEGESGDPLQRRREELETAPAFREHLEAQRGAWESRVEKEINAIAKSFPQYAPFNPINPKTFGLAPLFGTQDGVRLILSTIMTKEVSDYLYDRAGELRWGQFVTDVMRMRPEFLESALELQKRFGMRSMQNFLAGVKVVAAQKKGLSGDPLAQMVKEYESGTLRISPEDTKEIREYLGEASKDKNLVTQVYPSIMKKFLGTLTELYTSGDKAIRGMFERAPEFRQHLRTVRPKSKGGRPRKETPEKKAPGAPAKEKTPAERKKVKLQPETAPEKKPFVFDVDPSSEEWAIYSSTTPYDYRDIMAGMLEDGTEGIDNDSARMFVRLAMRRF